MSDEKWCRCDSAETSGVCPKCGGNFYTDELHNLPKGVKMPSANEPKKIK
jgi:hypothetical protein